MNSTTRTRDTALLVIDAQASFTRRPYYRQDGVAPWLEAQNRLIEAAQRADWALVRVFHVSPGAGPEDPFSLASGQVRPWPGLHPFHEALTVHKTRHSAAVGTDLAVWLTAQGMRRVVISGIRTEQCCETTARHLSDLGWTVDFALDATLTWDIPPAPAAGHAGIAAAALRERTAAALDGRFARVRTVADLVSESDASSALA
jgi:nicotinamidase-related amidase